MKRPLGHIVKWKKATCRIQSDTSCVRENKKLYSYLLSLHKEIPEYTQENNIYTLYNFNLWNVWFYYLLKIKLEGKKSGPV